MAYDVIAPETLPKDGATIPEPTDSDAEIIRILTGYRQEADNNRKGGMNPRDAKWAQNIDLYWNRYNFSGKAPWQAKTVMPEVPGFVDRFAAATKDALVSTDYYTVTDPYDTENDLTWAVKELTDAWLSQAGRNQVGTVLDFNSVFEEQMKMGALMACCGTVMWRKDVPGGRVAVETVDPREVWLDHTNRNLYRVRRVELDMADLLDMARQRDSEGAPIFNVAEIERAMAQPTADSQAEREALTGSGTDVSSKRRVVTLDEYIATVVSDDGRVLAKDELMVVANDKYLVRGPEANPYWHGRDWLVYTPLITSPLSVYGRTYMEDFGDIAKTFTELTNLILDATQTSAMKAFAMVPSMLLDPRQAQSGIFPNKTFYLNDGVDPKLFAQELSLGSLDPGAVQIWSSLKNELHEAAGINEVGMGQFAPKGRTSAMEVGAALNNSGAIVKSIAQTVETRFLNPVLDLTWKTGMQHISPDDKRMPMVLGQDMWSAIIQHREEIVKRPITFQAQGISSLIARQRTLQALLQLLGIISGSQDLMAAFMQRTDVNKLLDKLFSLSNINPKAIEMSDRDKLVQSIVQPLQQGAAGGTASPPGLAAMGGAANALGVQKGPPSGGGGGGY